MERIEFGKFLLTDKTKQNVLNTLESGWVTMGPVVKSFEEKWRKLFNYKYARALSSGTAADTAACMVLYEFGAQPGDEIICPALSFIATANSIRAAGFKPVFVDVLKETLQIDETKIEEKITNKTRAIMSVNLMGRPCELKVISNICMKHKLFHIIDNCEAYGSTLDGKHALEYGDMETSSHFTAHIIFSVEGGVLSSKFELFDRAIEAIRSHGRVGGGNYFNHEMFGLNFKPTDLNLSVGLEEVENFWDVYKTRKNTLNILRGTLVGFEDLAYFVEEDERRNNAPHAFSITMKQIGHIDRLKQALDDANIAWKRNFGSMPTQHKCFAYLGHKLGEFPNAEWIGDNGIHIGTHKYLTDDDIHRIKRTLYGFFMELRNERR